MNELIEYINNIYPLSAGLREYLLETITEITFAKKSFLLKPGQVCGKVYFIKSGLVRCFYEKDGQDVSSWFMKEGDVIISVESFFKQTKSTEYIQALEDLHVFFLEYNDLQYLFKTFIEFNFIGRVLTEQYYVLSEERLSSLRMQRSYERYNHLIKTFPEIIQRVPAKYVASYLGVTRETLSRIKGRR